MKEQDPFDRKLRDRFSEARQSETEQAPGFRSVLQGAPARRVVPRGRRFAILSAAAGLATVAVAAWLSGTGPEPLPPGTAFETPPGALLSPTVAVSRGPSLDSGPRSPVDAKPTIEAPRVAAESDIVDLEVSEEPTKFSDEYVQNLPDPGRFYQGVMAAAAGVPDVDGDGRPDNQTRRTYTTTIVLPPEEEDELDRRGALGYVGATDLGPRRPQRGFAPVVQLPDSDVVDGGFNTESYAPIKENEFRAVVDHPLSTFSIDVDTASYSNVRRFLRGGAFPPPGAVRIEEMINYFDYDYPAPAGREPFSVEVEVADCPWAPDHRLARVGLKGREVDRGGSGGSNLVFLIDVSGSMNAPRKLPLLKKALSLLVDQLDGRDRVAIVVYAGDSGLVLPSTPGSAREEILQAVQELRGRGGTNGASGLRLAYEVARRNFIKGGVNRVVLATDGDFNVGLTDRESLLRRVKKDARKGIFLTALGFGMGNYKDDMLELLADRGNGNYAYVDSLREARKVLVEEINATLVTIAKDVKIQVEFNPTEVGAYRLIGYENRALRKEEFNDDRKDAGEIGSGHRVTALYELVPPQTPAGRSGVDPLKYQSTPAVSEAAVNGETMTVKIRYKEPDGETSLLLEFPVVDDRFGLERAGEDFRFAAAVAAFGGILRGSSKFGEMTLQDVRELALRGIGADVGGYRGEFVELVGLAEALPGEERAR